MGEIVCDSLRPGVTSRACRRHDYWLANHLAALIDRTVTSRQRVLV